MNENSPERFYIVKTKNGYDVVYAVDLEHNNSKIAAKGIEEVLIKVNPYISAEADTERELLRLVNETNKKKEVLTYQSIKNYVSKHRELHFRYEEMNPEED